MAFECNLAAGNKAACQQHVTRQSVQHQQVLPEITGAPQTVHDPPPDRTHWGHSAGQEVPRHWERLRGRALLFLDHLLETSLFSET